MVRLLFSLLVWLALSSSARAEKRVALVVGVDGYASLQKLANPKRDAGALKAVLDTHKYDVTFVADPDFKAFLKALADFKRKARGADEALVYYAGHGMEAVKDGISQNILAPTDAEVSCETREALYVVTLNQLFEAMEGVGRRIVILDACRENPFRTCGARAASAGFGFRAALPQSQSQARSLLVFSTDLGQLASDGAAGLGSPFAAALVAKLKAEPRMPYRELFERVAGEVAAGGQKPWVVGIGGTLESCLAGAGCGAKGAEPVPPLPPQAPPAQTSEAAQSWRLIEAMEDVSVFEAYRKQFGAVNPFYDQLAAARITALKRAQEQKLAAAQPPAPAKKAPAKVVQPAAPAVGQAFRDCNGCPEMVVVPAGSFTMGSNEYDDEKAAPQGDDRQAIRGGQVRGDVRGVGSVRGQEGLRAQARDELGPGAATGAFGVVGRRQAVRGVAVERNRTELPPADRGGVGVRGAGRQSRALVVWRQRERVGWPRLVQRECRRQDAARRRQISERFRPARHARQRLGVGRGLLR